MSFAPTGEIFLLSDIFFDNTYTDTEDFSNLTDQHGWFMAKVSRSFTEYTYIRKDSTIRIGGNYEELIGLNYLMYHNYTAGKMIYAFILDKKYLSEGVTELTIEVDVFQTYMFDYTWHDTYIEREHQDRWTGVNEPIFNIVPESLTLGDEYIKENEIVLGYSDEYYLVVASQPLEATDPISNPCMVQSYPTPLFYYVIEPTQPQFLVIADNPSVVSVSLIPFLTFSFAALTPVTVTNEKYPDGIITLKRITANMPTRLRFPIANKFEGMDLPIFSD